MNIFMLDDDPVLAAQYQCNKHICKMTIETTQLLSNALWHYCLEGPYKHTHKNHPMSKWIQASRANFSWGCQHLEALCAEYTYRYNKSHKCSQYINRFYHAEVAGIKFPTDEWTDPPKCMPDIYKIPHDTVLSYRVYYIGAKAYFARWTRRPRPEWWHYIDEANQILNTNAGTVSV